MIVAGTGHRPKFLPCKYNEKHPWLLKLKQDTAEKLTELGVTNVISGMAIGWDTWLARVALDMGLKLHCYVPFEGQESKWPTPSMTEYRYLLDEAYSIIYLSKEYSNEAFLKRDRAMVNDADIIVALWNPEITQGGTYYTVKYAEQKGKKVINLWRPE